MNDTPTSSAEWLQPAVAQQGVRRFLQTLRERWRIAALVAIVVTAIAVVYTIVADEVYEAQVEMLVTPVPADDETLSSLGLIIESNDPTLDVQTAARLLTTVEVATEAQEALDSDEDVSSLLDDVRAEPIGQSNLIALIARGPTPEAAQTLATTFAEAAVVRREDDLRERIATILPRLQEQLGAVPPDGLAAQSLAENISQLETLNATGDPTIRLESVGELPESPVVPKRALTIAAGVIAGLLLGVLAAFGLQALDPRLRREEQLRSLFRLPVIGRVPRERAAAGPLPWRALSGAAVEGYRTLRATITAPQASGVRPRSILVTGPSPSEGKTTSALNLATSLALADNRVILIEADLRRPAIGGALSMRAERGVVAALLQQVSVSDALIPVPDVPGLEVLLAETSGPWASEIFSLPIAEALIPEAMKLADYVIVDSPPLTEVIDALPLARQVDEVLIVVRLGKSRVHRIRELGELLAANAIRPAGFAVLGSVHASGGGYYYYQDPTDGSQRPRRALWRTAEQQGAPQR